MQKVVRSIRKENFLKRVLTKSTISPCTTLPTVIGRLVLIGIDRPAVIGREGDKDTSGYISGDTGRFSSEIYFLTELL